jgi:hypothetical protein
MDDDTSGYNDGTSVATKEDLDVNLSAVTRTVHNVRVDAERQLRLLTRTLVVEVGCFVAAAGVVGVVVLTTRSLTVLICSLEI